MTEREQYPVCPCCDAGGAAYDAAAEDDGAEMVDVTCDECRGCGDGVDLIATEDDEPALPCCQWDPGAPHERMTR
jgi:hypothetical protein